MLSPALNEEESRAEPVCEPVVVPRRWLALAFLSLISAFSLADRYILAVLVEPIRLEMALSDIEVGLLTGTFFGIVYSVLSLPVAFYADRAPRVRLIAIACSIWSMFTAFTGLATSFVHLAICRIGVAVGESGVYATSMSLISDYFPSGRRVLAISIFTLASAAGLFFAMFGGGVIAASYGWRHALVLPGIAGMVLALTFWLFIREPVRGAHDDPLLASREAAPVWETVKLFFKLRSLMWLLFATAFWSAATDALVVWGPALLVRSLGAGMKEVAISWGIVNGGSMAVGVIASGFLLSWLNTFSLRAYMLVPAATMALSAPMLWFAFSTNSLLLFLIAVSIPIALTSVAVPPTGALVQELAPPRQRATAMALMRLVTNMIGTGMGAVLVGVVSEWFKPEMGAESLRYALIITIPPLCLASAFGFYMASRPLIADHARMRTSDVKA